MLRNLLGFIVNEVFEYIIYIIYIIFEDCKN